MRWLRNGLVLALAVGLTGAPALAQEDLLMPLVPVPTKPKKKRPKPKPAAKPPPASDASDLLAPLPAAKSELVVKLAPGAKAGAVLFLDGKEVGPLTSRPHVLPPGEHSVVVRRPGYAELNKKVNLVAGKTTEVVAVLSPISGFLSVRADQTGAQVLIDDQLVGEVPLSELLVAPGSREVVVRKEGFEESRQSVTVLAGKDYTVSAQLTVAARTVTAYADRPENPVLVPADSEVTSSLTPGPSEDEPLYTRWYVWAGAAAVVVAAATTFVVVSSPQKFDKHGACGGHCDAFINEPAGLRPLGAH
ncbi:MAG: PEGA domain-containing protein [Myxococcota bacterium]